MATTLWYSTQILLQSDDSEIFNGYFSVVKANPTDTQGLINHFYDVLGNDLFRTTGFVSADSVFLIDENRLSALGLTTKSFPYLNNIYNNNYFLIKQNPDSSGFGKLNTLNLLGYYQLQFTDVKFVHTSISEPTLPIPPTPPTPDPATFWFSSQVTLPDNTEIFNGYFSVVRAYPSDTYGLVTTFYDNSFGVNVFVNDGFVGADRVFYLDTLQFSSTGTTVTYFPYFKNLYAISGAYSLQHNDISDNITVVHYQGNIIYDTVNVTITNTALSEQPPPKTTWLSTNVKLASDNTEIFNGYFSVVDGFVNHFYDASNQVVDIFVNNGFYGSDRIFSFGVMNYTVNGTIITSFPYFKNLYSNSAFYSLWHDAVPNESYVSPLDTIGDPYTDVLVIITNTIISDPFPRTLWYSTQILLQSDDSEIFNGYFSVIQESPTDTQGLINHFYDQSGNDLLSTNYVGADRVFLINDNRLSNLGITTKSFPYLNNIYNNNYFLIKQNPDSSGFGQLNTLNLLGYYQLQFTDVKFVHTSISEPTLPIPPTPPTPDPATFWYSSQVTLPDNTEIFNGYFSVVRANPSDTYGLVTAFYDASGTGSTSFVNDGFVGADRVFFLDTLKFSSTGTTITSFQYFKNLYSTSAVYSLQHSTSLDTVAVIFTQGQLLDTVNVTITNTQVSDPTITVWYSIKVKLASNNTEIFSGYFGVSTLFQNSTQGDFKHFYNEAHPGVDIFINNGYYGSDSVFLRDSKEFSGNGTIITSFPYFKNLYSNSVFYSFYHDYGGSWASPLTANGAPLDDIGVIITNTPIADPFPITLWYSTQILLQSDDSEIFNGYFSVVKANPTDTTGLVTHFYDVLNQGVDIFVNNGFYGSDSIFSFDEMNFKDGTIITTFPYFKNLYSNSAFYSFYHDYGGSWASPLDINGDPFDDVSVIITNSPISWYSLQASIENIDGVTNTTVKYYFSLDISSSSVTGFYSYKNIGVNLLLPIPPSLPFFTPTGSVTRPPYYTEADNVFNTATLKFSDNNGINFTDTYLQMQPVQYRTNYLSSHYNLTNPLFSFYGFDYGSGFKNYLWAYAGPDPFAYDTNVLLTNSVDIQLLSGPPLPLTLKTVLNNGSLWVAGGSLIATSTDGKSWTTVPSSPTNVNSLAFTGSQWIACCDGSNNIYSGTSDANSWYLSTTLSSHNLFKVAFANNTLFALSTGTIFYSTDLNVGSWSTYTAAVGDITGFAYTSSKFLFSSATNVISTQDLTTWTVTSSALPSVTKALSLNNSLEGAATVKPIVVACTDSSFNTLGYTIDGIQWYGCGNTALQTRANHAAWNGSLWVAVGKSASTWFSWSRDGIHWVYQPDTLFDEAFSLAWNGSIWVAAGEGAAFSLATSTDGITWIGVSESKTVFVDRAIDIKWTGAQWVACGSPSIVASSLDANTWTLTNNVLVGDLSSVLFSFTATATSNSGTAPNAFDLSSATAWTSQTGAYDASSGLLLGTAENVQITFLSNVVVNQYFLQSSAVDWTLQGSNDGSIWTTLHAVIDSTSSFFSFANTTPYTQYRVVFYKIAAYSGLTYVQATNIDFFQRQALPKFYRMNNTKRGVSYFVNTGYSTWLQQYDASAVLTPVKKATSFSYDGKNSVITDISTNGVFYTTQIDVSLSSIALPYASYTSCFNGTHFFVGGTNSQIAYAHPSDMTSWYTVLTPFTGGNILSLVSNSGIGFVSPPNSLYLDPGDKLSLVAPKFYDINLVGRGPTFNFGLGRA